MELCKIYLFIWFTKNYLNNVENNFQKGIFFSNNPSNKWKRILNVYEKFSKSYDECVAW